MEIFVGGLRLMFSSIGSAVWSQRLRTAAHEDPEEFIVAVVLLAVLACAMAYGVYMGFTYFYSRQFTRFPQPIAQAMRKALYYSEYEPNPERALRYYQQALELCDQFRYDIFSDEVLGIKIQLAAWLEKNQNYHAAITILETVLTDCKRWVEVMEESVAKGTVDPAAPGSVASDDEDSQQMGPAQPYEHLENLWGKRRRILAKSIGVGVKLGELHANEHVLEPDIAHERLVWAVETSIRELNRRTRDGVKDGEGEWMTAEAMGGTLEALGHSYESRSQFHLAIPLFFQALQLCQDPCHISVLMNNLAACFAQHPTHAPFANMGDGPTPKTPAEARRSYLESSQRWALSAYKHAVDTKGDKRTPECDESCVVSLCNLGDIALLQNNVDEARRHFEQGRDMSKMLDFRAGVKQAEQGLQRVMQRSDANGPRAVMS